MFKGQHPVGEGGECLKVSTCLGGGVFKGQHPVGEGGASV